LSAVIFEKINFVKNHQIKLLENSVDLQLLPVRIKRHIKNRILTISCDCQNMVLPLDPEEQTTEQPIGNKY
jgi:hypothetical protein